MKSREWLDHGFGDNLTYCSNVSIVCVSSMSGIAGNFGQTNYATSKIGVIGYVEAMTSVLAERNITIDLVASVC